MLQSDPVPGSQPPVASDVNIFDVLTGNRIMKVINTELVQIMIATEGMDFYDKQNTEKAEMLGTSGDQCYRRCFLQGFPRLSRRVLHGAQIGQ